MLTAVVSFKSGIIFGRNCKRKTETANNHKAPSNRVAFLWAINSRVLMCTKALHKQNGSATLPSSSLANQACWDSNVCNTLKRILLCLIP